MKPSLLTLSAAALLCACKPEPRVVRYEAAPEATATAETAAPAAQSPAPAAPTLQAPASMKAEAAGFSAPKWAALPAGWSVGPENAMRKGTFIVPGPDGSKAELAVTVFPGSVGGLTANVNRWRGQIGLPPADEASIRASAQEAKVGPDSGMRFIMKSGDGAKATDAVMVPKGGSTWFLKLSGDTKAVESAGAAFVKFIADSQLP
ncbi:MAG: hypothetical protein FJ410_07260 [Verrucomicrobia bacterium]|nr:hypothetical protein [Verrucomicrobiota bacterium]